MLGMGLYCGGLFGVGVESRGRSGWGRGRGRGGRAVALTVEDLADGDPPHLVGLRRR